MKRRKFILGLGTAVGASGTAFGSGAFTSVSADRDVTVETAADANAYLAMEPLDTPNGNAYATTVDDLIALEFTDTDAGGAGVGTDSVYNFHDVFRITNQGTQPVYVWATFADAEGDFTVGDSDTDIWLYANGDPADKLRDSEDDVLYLSVGSSANIGVHVDTFELEQNQDLTITINANVDNPGTGDVVGDDGSTILGPTDGLIHYWPLDQVGTGVASDIVGTNNGQIGGDVSEVGGKVGNAANFDGDGDYIDTTVNPNIGSNESRTVTFWFKSTDTVDRQWIYGVLSGGNYWEFGYHDNEMEWFLKDDDNNKISPGTNTDLRDGNWHHISLVLDRGEEAAKVFVDGVDEATSDASVIGKITAADSAFFGARNKNGSVDTNGDRETDMLGDDLRVYNRALSDSEVQTLYTETW